MKITLILSVLSALACALSTTASADVFFKKVEVENGILCVESDTGFKDAIGLLNKRLSDELVIVQTDFKDHIEYFVSRPFTVTVPMSVDETQPRAEGLVRVTRACVSLNHLDFE